MLQSLYVENIAVARRMNWECRRGFTVLTGETGAGKSVLLDCLSLVTGGKAQRDWIRAGEDRAVVSAVFSDVVQTEALAGAGIEPDENGEIEIIRSIGADGRSSVKINRRSVPLSVLREIGSSLVSIQAQSGTHDLLDPAVHMTILDSYADMEEYLEDYRLSYRELLAVTAAADSLRESMQQKNMLVDILKYQIKEIDAARLHSADEEAKLESTRAKIKNMERIAKYSGFVYRALAQSEKGASASVLLQKSAAAMRQLADVMPEADELAAKLENYRYEIEDIGETARALIDDSEVQNPEQQLTAIESRLNLIERLKRKYGNTIEEILRFRKTSAAKLAELESGDEKLSELGEQIQRIRRDLSEKAGRISERRRARAEEFSRLVGETLSYLDMPKARFTIEVRKMYAAGQEQFGPDGSDSVMFLIAANPGEEPMPLARVASGGEMSRILLSIRSVMNTQSGAGTVVFDEIDAGVSGGTSEKIGMKLKEISRGVQVFCVTHSPQIAALADTHLCVRKKEQDGRAESFLEELDTAGRISEIARIIGGVDVTDTQREAAREMILHNNTILS